MKTNLETKSKRLEKDKENLIEMVRDEIHNVHLIKEELRRSKNMVEQEKYVSRKRADLEVRIAKGKVSRIEDIGNTVTRISSSPDNEEECNDETLTDKEE